MPTIWTLETAQFAVGAYYILGAGYSLQQDAHVRMDFLYANWKPRIPIPTAASASSP